MNKSETQVIQNVIARLRAQQGGSDYIHQVLADPRFNSWLETWVLSGLDVLVKDKRSQYDLAFAVRITSA
jgi:hypothetical protein